ncbi:Acetyl-coenzyme A transporter 1 [Cinara cedri]|uniref:Acetyl-coenzyme A transporter 1 n=1 Tax=Cinara cedri TaxID=506608 RepID=A0A5E4MGB6_9HEMI|nr:Acetyl-coenzyme A transporter 1 [Cinara cedri]
MTLSTIADEIQKFAHKHETRLDHHVNPLAIQLLDNSKYIRRRNAGYASICNAISKSLGNLICVVCLILLTSEDFSNKYLWTVNDTGGLVTIKEFSLNTKGVLKEVADLANIDLHQLKLDFQNSSKRRWMTGIYDG